VAVHPLRSATHRRLGGPLPHQLANGTRAHLSASLFLPTRCLTKSLSGLSSTFTLLSRSERQIAHALLTRPPLKYQIASFISIFARLACIKHAASVRPEPGSNSPLNLYLILSDYLSIFPCSLIASSLVCLAMIHSHSSCPLVSLPAFGSSPEGICVLKDLPVFLSTIFYDCTYTTVQFSRFKINLFRLRGC
jgi:hypothetical protein